MCYYRCVIGTLIRFMTKVTIENWSTQLAASILSAGIIILELRNHTPTSSINMTTIKDNNIWIVTDAENILFNLL